MSLNISPKINKTNILYVVFNSVDYSYVKHICFSNNTDSSFIDTIKLNGIKINSYNKISEIICDTNPVISDFIDSHWENNYILVIINNIVIYPCMNKDEFNLDTSGEIIDYLESINKAYYDKFNSKLVFPNQFYGDSWRKRIDTKFAKNITIQIRELITNFKNLYNLKIDKYKYDKNKDFIDELTNYFNTNIRKITYEIRSLFQIKDHCKKEVNVFLDNFINYVKDIIRCENTDLKEISENALLNNEENKKNIINLNNKLFFQKIMNYQSSFYTFADL
jgi:hypothetical protein